MSETQFTEGPWKVVDHLDDDDELLVDRDEQSLLSRFAPAVVAECKQGRIEDARLISAAPDLYAACAEFVRKCECGEAKSVRSYEQMKAALAKANPS